MKRIRLHKKLYLIMGFTIISIGLYSQGTLLQGKVESADDGMSLPGASVVEMDNSGRVIAGTTTDAFGKYMIMISSPENTIVFSFIGFKKFETKLNSRKEINVQLESEGLEIQGVDIVAERKINDGFLNISERNLTTSVQRMDAKEIENVQASSIDEAMQGRLAGVDIVASSGDPGAGMSIRIRGTSSINSSSEPLIVVDNIPYDTQISSDFDFATADEEGYAQMLNISPDDIQEIVVLKDAAATAVWGSKAANGVLMIKTKRGKMGPPKVKYSYKLSVSEQPDPIPMLNGDQYSMMILEGYMNLDGTPFPADNLELWYDPEWEDYYNYSQNTNWIDAVTRTGFTNDHNLSLTGGGEKVRYRMSVGYLEQTGTTLGTDLQKLSTRLNLDYYVSDKITFSTDISYNRGDNNKSYPDIDTKKYEHAGIREIAYKKMPNMAIYEMDQNGLPTNVFLSPDENSQGGWYQTYNPVAMAEKGQYNILNNRIIPKFSVRYNILENLNYNFDVAFDVNNEKRNSFLPQEATGKNWTDAVVNRAGDLQQDKFSVQTFNKLYYNPNLGDQHDLMLLLSLTTNDVVTYASNSYTANSASTLLRDPSITSRIYGGEDLEVNSGKSRSRDLAGLFSFSYSLKDRYIVSGSLRRDGSSKFGRGKRWGNFPAVSARWRISGEPFMQSLAFLDDLSIRASYGENGNAPGKSYSQFNTYGVLSWNYLGQAAIYSKSIEQANKKWETTIQKNIGFELIMFDNAINMDVDFYHKRTNDLYFDKLQIPTTSGFDEIGMNAGVMDNIGWEVNIICRVLDKRDQDLTLDFNFNVARNVNVIREISELYQLEKGSAYDNGEYLQRIQIDNPLGSFYGYVYDGVYIDEQATIAYDEFGNQIQDINGNPVYMTFGYPLSNYIFQEGDAIYRDINHDGNINELDVVYLGNAYPLLTGGFGPIIKYKGLSVNTFFHFRYGSDIINRVRMETEKMNDYDNQSTAVLRRWRNPGDETDIPRAVLFGGYNYLGSSRFVEDGSFLRLKYITTFYDIPEKFVKKYKLSSARIGLTVKNVLTWTNYTGQDPEVSLKDSDPFSIGYDKSRTPRAKEIQFTLSFSF